MRATARVFAFAFSLLLATGLVAQSTSLSGTVTDPSSAVVPNAAVSLVNTETGVARETKSDAQGRYTFAQLSPGKYNLTVKAGGFAESVVSNIELLVNQPATIPVTLKVGATSTTVTVEAGAVQVNTTDASIGNAISTTAILQLPLFARNVPDLLQFQPGVTQGGQVNGGKSDQANVTLDGADVNDQRNRSAFTSVLRVTQDSVEEFRVTTTNGNADQGRSSGAQIALVTKSGSNGFHGSLYENRRGTETAANTFFNNLSGVPNTPLLINVFGVSLGGPIKKNKLFYFVNYEGRRDASSSAATTPPTVPSDLMRQGILQYKNTAGNIVQLNAAAIKSLDPAGIGISQATQALFALYPHGNATNVGDGLNFIGDRFNAPTHSVQNTYIAKIDYQIDSNAKHTVFWRGNLQNDSADGLPQFQGQAPASVTLNNSKGMAMGYTAVIRPNLISTFNYGFTRQGTETTGVLSGNYASFRSLSTIFPTTTGSVRLIPVNGVTENIAWTHGAHDVRIGAVARFISTGTRSYSNSFSNTSSNVSWLLGTGKDLQPSDLLSSFRTAFTDAMAAMVGIQAQGTAHYNYNVDGSVVPTGAPTARTFNNEEYEWFIQDTWKVNRGLTVTAGLRHSLMPPIYEANGQQTSTNVSIGDWFYTRAALANVGQPQSLAPTITYIAPSDPNFRELYPNHLKNFAPRLALAYSPQATSGWQKWLFGGPGKTSIRLGGGMFYDLFGQPLAQTYAASAFGLSTSLSNAASSVTSITAPRYTGFYTPPAALFPAAPKGGFPATYPNLFAITNSIDDTLKPPYTENFNFSIGRDLGHGWYVQGAYVGRFSHRSLINKDLAMPTNLKDPTSGQTYFQAAQAVAVQYNQNHPGSVGSITAAEVAAIPKQAFWENLWPGLAGTYTVGGQKMALTATQEAYIKMAQYEPDYTSALYDLDVGCSPACSKFGPYAIFNSQFSALSAWSSVGRGNYHAMQWSVRKSYSNGLVLDFNYTWSKSEDLASSAENAGSFGGLLQNDWFPQQQWSVSDYDATHQISAYAVYQLPVGKGKKYLGSSNRAVDAFLGGWQIATTYLFSSSTPVSVNDGRNWATNWEISTNADQIAPISTSPNKLAPAVAGTPGPNLFANPSAALAAYGFSLPGESGQRNVLRTPGPWSMNLGVSKEFSLFTIHDNPHKLQFRWETFNLTNTAIMSGVSLGLGSGGTFGQYSSQRVSPRQMQFALKYVF
jgi:hypothetical protein